MTPYLCRDPFNWPALLALLRAEFAYMQGRIDPPSSLQNMSAETLATQSETAEIWATGQPPIACVILTPKADALYIGKLAVSHQHRGQGLAKTLIDLASSRANALGKPWLELETRVELVENQATFAALGFQEIARSAHAGYARPTSITYRRATYNPAL